MISRKDFLKISGLASISWLLYPIELISDLFAVNKKPDNFCILFDQTEISEIKKRLKLPIFQSFWKELLNLDLQADREFLEKRVELTNHLRHLPRVNRILQREAFVYAMTQHRTRGEMARLALHKIFLFKKWDYFLEAGKDVIGLQRAPFTTQSLILAYDWLYDLLMASEKDEILTQLPEKGCEPCYRSLYGMLYPEKVIGWSFDPESSFQDEIDMSNWPRILARNNLHVIPMSGLGLGAIFLNGIDPRAKKWMEIVEKSFDEIIDLYEQDGSYAEGAAYCRYASTELILFLEMLRRHHRKDWYKRINWPGVMDFLMMTRMPSKNHPDGYVNFGDAAERIPSSIGFWVAKRYNDPLSQYAAKYTSTGHNIFSAIWYEPNIQQKKPEGGWFYRHYTIGWVIVSTGFEPDDFVVALRSGGPANHEHADRNSLILKCFNENLIVDNWNPPYSRKHPAWSLRTSPAHNTVLVDGKGHQYHDGKEGTNSSSAKAKIVHETVTDEYVIVSSDATQAYQLVNNNIKTVNRTLLTVPELKFVVVVDTLHTEFSDATFAARWFVDNEDGLGKIETNGNRFTFIRSSARLIGCCEGSHGIQLSTDHFPVPEEYGTYPYLDVKAGKSCKKCNLITAVAAIQHKDGLPTLGIKRNRTGSCDYFSNGCFT